MLAYDYPLLGIFWSLVLLFMFVMVGFVVIYTFIDNFRRPDHSGLAKAGGRCSSSCSHCSAPSSTSSPDRR